ncbi:MAG: hypothetical protein Q8755_02840 [Candidatus Phytoplasma australasiaticum]|nr:hypothetical protein [Candidatus Phytoplasma australasiaticum]
MVSDSLDKEYETETATGRDHLVDQENLNIQGRHMFSSSSTHRGQSFGQGHEVNPDLHLLQHTGEGHAPSHLMGDKGMPSQIEGILFPTMTPRIFGSKST